MENLTNDEENIDEELKEKITQMVSEKLGFTPSKAEPGMRLYQDGDVEGAIEVWNNLVSRDPKDYEAWRLLGLAYHEEGDLENAINAYQRAIELNAEDIELLKNQGKALFDSGKISDAIKLWRKAIEVDGEDIQAYLMLAYGLEESGALKEALEVYDQLTDIDPVSIDGWINKGFIFMREEVKDLEKAKKFFEKALDIDDSNPTAFYNLACVSALEGNLQDTIIYLERMLEIEPDWIDDIQDEADFDGVRDHEDFKKLMKEYA